MKKLVILAVSGLLLAAPAAAQDRLDRDIDQLRGYGQYDRYDGYDRYRSNSYDSYGRYGQYGGYRTYDDRYDRPNSWGGSYRQEPGPRYGYSDGDRQYDRRTGIVRLYRDGSDYCFYRGDRRNGWSC